MNLKEQLAAKQAELTALKSRIEGDDADAIAEGEGISAEIADIEGRIAQAEAKASLLAQMKSDEGVSVKSGEHKTLGQALVDGIKSAGSRFDVATPYMKEDATVSPTTSLSVDTFNRTVPALPARKAVASLMGGYTVEGDSYTFIKRDPFTGEFAKVEEGAKKGFVRANYDKKTVTIEKVAAYTKYTSELAWDNAFLPSAIEREMLLMLGKKEDAYIIADILADTGIKSDVTYDASEDLGLVEAIMKARAAISENTAYEADAVIINPADMVTLQLAKDANGDYYGRNFFAGTPDQPTIWGLQVFQSANIPAGTVLVGAFKDAVKVVRNGGVMAAATNTNEDDFVNNLMTLLVEERFATAVEVPAAIYKVSAAA